MVIVFSAAGFPVRWKVSFPIRQVMMIVVSDGNRERPHGSVVHLRVRSSMALSFISILYLLGGGGRLVKVVQRCLVSFR